jgi:hypothetical protein
VETPRRWWIYETELVCKHTLVPLSYALWFVSIALFQINFVYSFAALPLLYLAAYLIERIFWEESECSTMVICTPRFGPGRLGYEPPPKPAVRRRATPEEIARNTETDLWEIASVEEKTRAAIKLQRKAEVQAARAYFTTITTPETQDLSRNTSTKKARNDDDTDGTATCYAAF